MPARASFVAGTALYSQVRSSTSFRTPVIVSARERWLGRPESTEMALSRHSSQTRFDRMQLFGYNMITAVGDGSNIVSHPGIGIPQRRTQMAAHGPVEGVCLDLTDTGLMLADSGSRSLEHGV